MKRGRSVLSPTDGCRRPGPTSGHGFTLVEVLVGVALGSILLVSLYSVFFTVFRAGSSAGEALDRRIEVARLFDSLAAEIHSAYLDANSGRTFFRGGPDGPNSVLEFTPYKTPVVKRGAPYTDLAAVRYSVEEGPEGFDLVRSLANPFTGKKVKTVLLEDIEGFKVSFFTGSDWVGAWDGKLDGGLPVAVRVTVAFDGGTELTALARTMIR